SGATVRLVDHAFHRRVGALQALDHRAAAVAGVTRRIAAVLGQTPAGFLADAAHLVNERLAGALDLAQVELAIPLRRIAGDLAARAAAELVEVELSRERGRVQTLPVLERRGDLASDPIAHALVEVREEIGRAHV